MRWEIGSPIVLLSLAAGLIGVLNFLANAVVSGYLYEQISRYVRNAGLLERVKFALVLLLVPADQRERFVEEQIDEQLDVVWQGLTVSDRGAAIELLGYSVLIGAAVEERRIALESTGHRLLSLYRHPPPINRYLVEGEIVAVRTGFHRLSLLAHLRPLAFSLIAIAIAAYADSGIAELRRAFLMALPTEETAESIQVLRSYAVEVQTEVASLFSRVLAMTDVDEEYGNLLVLLLLIVVAYGITRVCLSLAVRLLTVVPRDPEKMFGYVLAGLFVLLAIRSMAHFALGLVAISVYWIGIGFFTSWRDVRFSQLVLSSRRLIVVESFGSVTVSSVPWSRITGCDLKQGPIGAITGYGHLTILTETGERDGIEVPQFVQIRTLRFVQDPNEIWAAINNLTCPRVGEVVNEEEHAILDEDDGGSGPPVRLDEAAR